MRADSLFPGGERRVGLGAAGSLRWVAVDVTGVLEEARRRHDLSPLAAVALGRTLAAAAMIQRISLKESSRVVVEVQGDGPLGSVVAEAEDGGGLRGYVGDPHVATPQDGRLQIAASVGSGSLQVSREWRGRRHESQVNLVSGELGDDVAHFLEQSEQIRSAVLLGVMPRSAGIETAGGLIVEALPGAEEDSLARLESNLRCLDGVSALLKRGGVDALVGSVLSGLDAELVERQPLEFRCACSRSGLLDRILSQVEEDPGVLPESGPEGEAACSFCGARYPYSADELRREN